MAGRQGFRLMGEGGVVVIDADRASVRLVRGPAAGEVEGEGDALGLEAQEVLMGFLQLTGRGWGLTRKDPRAHGLGRLDPARPWAPE
jgi:hypothetical protein